MSEPQPIHHSLVRAAGTSPARWMFFVHGVFGSGANWRLFARKLAQVCPSWGMILVDVRGHGASPSPPPPHTLESAADDLQRLEDQLGLDVQGICGHSLGGKIALAYLDRRSRPVEQAWILDALPGSRPAPAAAAVLAMLRALPQPLPSRERFVELVMGSGYGRDVADWLAMNVRPSPDGLRLRVDLSIVEQLLQDHASQDLWHVLERDGASALHLVIADRSDVWADADRERAKHLGAITGRVHVHVLEGAGHWLHVDDPEGLLELLRSAPCESPPGT